MSALWPFSGGAELPFPLLTPAGFLQLVLRGGREGLVGRRVTVPTRNGDAEMTVTDLTTEFDTLGLARGQVDELHLTAEDVVWDGTEVRRLVMVCRNVRLRSVPLPTVLAGPVDIEITVGADVVNERVARLRPDLEIDIGSDNTVAVRWRRLARVGHLRVRPLLENGRVWLRPKSLVLGTRRIGLGTDRRGLALDLPELPRRLTLVDIELGDGELILRATAQEWRASLSPRQLAELVRALGRAGATLVLPRAAGRD